MSEGDVIRLNRMYKCEPPYQTQPSTEPTQVATSKEEISIDETQSDIEIVKPKKSKLFGIIIFRSVGEN